MANEEFESLLKAAKEGWQGALDEINRIKKTISK